MIKGTKLDFYSVASPSPFAHRQITWPMMVMMVMKVEVTVIMSLWWYCQDDGDSDDGGN